MKARYPPITVTAGTTKTKTNKKTKKTKFKKNKKSKYNKNDDVVRNYSEMLYEKQKKAKSKKTK